MKKRTIHTIAGGLLLAAGLLTLSALAAAQAAPGSNDPGKKEPTELPGIKKAVEFLQKNKGAEARKAYQEEVDKDPTLSPYNVWLADKLFTSNNADAVRQARQLLEQELLRSSNHPGVWLLSASVALIEGRTQDAILNCQMAQQAAGLPEWNRSQKKKFERDANLGLAAAFERRGQWAAAKSCLDYLANETDKPEAGILVRLAHAQFMSISDADSGRERKEKETIDSLKKAADLDKTIDPPEDWIAQWQGQKVKPAVTRPEALKNQEAANEKAEIWYKKAIELYPEKAVPYLAYGGWLLDKGDITKAESVIKTGLSKEPNAKDETLVHRKKAIQGLLYRYQKEPRSAEQLFNELWSAKPDDFNSANQLTLSLIEQDDEAKKKKAVSLARATAQANERAPEARATLGWCLLRSGRTEEAERELGAAISGGQASPDTVYYLAYLYNQKDKFEEAYKALKQALQTMGAFVHRAEAQKLFTALDMKVSKKFKDDLAKEEKDAEDAAKAAASETKEKEPTAVKLPGVGDKNDKNDKNKDLPKTKGQ